MAAIRSGARARIGAGRGFFDEGSGVDFLSLALRVGLLSADKFGFLC